MTLKYHVLGILFSVWSLHGLQVPNYDHIVVVIEENHSFSQIIGSSTGAPYLNSLVPKSALFTNSNFIIHPSQPNYLAIFSGSTQGVTDDNLHPKFNTPNIAQLLLAAGQTIQYYSEDLPSVGFDGEWSGNYGRKHNASTQFSNIPTSVNVPFTMFPSDFTKLPKISFVVPNVINDAHSGTVTQMDNWLKQYIDPYAQWAVNNNSLLIITFDEPVGNDIRIPTLFYGAHVKPGQYNESINHYTVLRVLEDASSVGYAGASAQVTPITDVWENSNPLPTPTFSSSVTQNTNGSATLSFTPLNWISKSVQLVYTINNGAKQIVPTTNNTGTWTVTIPNLKSNDIISYHFDYEWNGQVKLTVSQQFTYIGSKPITVDTQLVQASGPSTAFVEFTPSQAASSVVMNYAVNGGALQQANLQSTNDAVWTFTVSNLNAGDQIAYLFTYFVGSSAVTTTNYFYTFQPVNPTPTPTPTPTPATQGGELLLQLTINLPTATTTEYVMAYWTVNGGAQQSASMIPQCNNDWIVLIPSLKANDQVSYYFGYSQNGQAQTSAVFNFTVS